MVNKLACFKRPFLKDPRVNNAYILRPYGILFKRSSVEKISKYVKYSCDFSPSGTFKSDTILDAICTSY